MRVRTLHSGHHSPSQRPLSLSRDRGWPFTAPSLCLLTRTRLLLLSPQRRAAEVRAASARKDARGESLVEDDTGSDDDYYDLLAAKERVKNVSLSFSFSLGSRLLPARLGRAGGGLSAPGFGLCTGSDHARRRAGQRGRQVTPQLPGPAGRHLAAEVRVAESRDDPGRLRGVFRRQGAERNGRSAHARAPLDAAAAHRPELRRGAARHLCADAVRSQVFERRYLHEQIPTTA